MKEETKELVNWIKCQILTNQDISYKITKAATDKYQKTKESALKFLNSLPEIESHLCRGGYIQDKNGVPCCEGDQIINPSLLDGTKELGTLYWSKNDCRFYFKKEDKCYSLTVGFNGFEKVVE